MSINLSKTDIEILDLLRKGEKNIADIARELGKGYSTVWKSLKRLEQLGLVKRKYTSDGRAIYILPKEVKQKLEKMEKIEVDVHAILVGKEVTEK